MSQVATQGCDVSVVMPCLNEERSVALCVSKAMEGIRRSGMRGEVIVVDNGSTDQSAELASRAGARVVTEPKRGYGNAYRAGFRIARGRFLVMGDADDSYDFHELGVLVAPLTAGFDYVLGSRFGGDLLPGSMTWSHRYLGNPVLTSVLNRFFGLKSTDAHSGMRAFTRDAYTRMEPTSPGMEFASELVINSALLELKVAEVPITYRPRIGETKLRTFRDGWRHLRYMLLRCPQWLFVIPGIVLLLTGVLGQLVLLPGWIRVGDHQPAAHFSIVFALLGLLGIQALTFGVFGRVFNSLRGIEPPGRLTDWFSKRFYLEHWLLVGASLFLLGFAIDAAILITWLERSMGSLDAIKPALLGSTIMATGGEVIFGAFFLGLIDPSGPLRLDPSSRASRNGISSSS